MKISPAIRAAIVAGTAAGLTFAIAFSGHTGSVTVHNASAEAAPPPTEMPVVTSSTWIEREPVVEVPTTTTTTLPSLACAAPAPYHCDPPPESTTTTTAAVVQPDVSFYYESHSAPGAQRQADKWFVVLRQMNPGNYPGLVVSVTVNTLEGPVTVEATGINTFTVELDPTTLPLPTPTPEWAGEPLIFQSVNVTWDGA